LLRDLSCAIGILIPRCLRRGASLYQYKKIDEKGRPDWSFQEVAPSIPFVENNLKCHRILAYGSAENLTYLNAPKKKLDINITPCNTRKLL